jgi:hypothetical protein
MARKDIDREEVKGKDFGDFLKRPVRPKPPVGRMRFLVVSGKDEMKLSRTVDAYMEDISQTGILFKTNSMVIDDLHLSYDETPLLRNRLIIELELPNVDRKIKALAEVSWYERSLVSRDEVYHIGASFKEMSDEDREILKNYLLETKKLTKTISLK